MQNNPSKVMVLLSHEMDTSGHLNIESQARADLALKLFECGDYDAVLTLGWAYRPDCQIPIALSMRDYLILKNLNPRKIFTDITSRDTVGDAVFSRINFIDPKNIRSFDVVTSDYHVKRTEKIFSFVYGPDYPFLVFGSQTASPSNFVAQEKKSTNSFIATFGDITQGNIKKILKQLQEHHPFYNGSQPPHYTKVIVD